MWNRECFAFTQIIEEHFKEIPEFSQKSEAEITQALAASPELPENPFLGGTINSEISPGNYTVQKEADKIVVDFYDESGFPYRRAWNLSGTEVVNYY